MLKLWEKQVFVYLLLRLPWAFVKLASILKELIMNILGSSAGYWEGLREKGPCSKYFASLHQSLSIPCVSGGRILMIKSWCLCEKKGRKVRKDTFHSQSLGSLTSLQHSQLVWPLDLELSELWTKMNVLLNSVCGTINIKQTNEMAWCFRCSNCKYADSIIFIL